MKSRRLPLLALALLGGSAAACGAEQKVSRVYDGKVLEQRFISPDAYGAFLRGALAEAAGDLRGALTAYGQAVEEDDEDPEIFTRMAEVRCAIDPRDAEIDRLFARATKLDPAYASTLAGQARCATRRGNAEAATAFAARASAADPKNPGIESLYLRTAAARREGPNEAADRQRAIALTKAHGSREEAWDALVAWGRARRDAELVARGLEGLVHAAPARSAEVERGAVLFLEDGKLLEARRLAVAVADAPRELDVRGPHDATVARLAVDEALVRGDRERAVARATRGHVPLAELSARALLLDKKDLATAFAKEVADADPASSAAQMMRAALRAPATTAPATPNPAAAKTLTSSLGKSNDHPPELCALVFADRLAAAGGVDAAREWLAKTTRMPMAAHDPLGAPLSADLTKRGVLPPVEASAPLASPEKTEKPPR